VELGPTLALLVRLLALLARLLALHDLCRRPDDRLRHDLAFLPFFSVQHF
jgi:hypothetical protein